MSGMKKRADVNAYKLQVMVDEPTFLTLGHICYESDVKISALGRKILKRAVAKFHKSPLEFSRWLNDLGDDK